MRPKSQGRWAATGVAQVSNLLYRRFPIGRMRERPSAFEWSHGTQAGSPAIQQVGNLRYYSGGEHPDNSRCVQERSTTVLTRPNLGTKTRGPTTPAAWLPSLE